ncbi:lamin-A-like [Ascaphus truei]|uniref:lamin-A-like n=1 Tax=Ascaphus truei TaxID=8439 RepID=UPI003F59F7E8
MPRESIGMNKNSAQLEPPVNMATEPDAGGHPKLRGEHLTLRYEAKMVDARNLLDHMANERARLQLELDNVREEHQQLQIRNREKETDLSLTLSQQGDVESQLNSKDAELATALSGKRSAERQLQERKTQKAILECSLSDTMKWHESRIVEIDSRHQTEFKSKLTEAFQNVSKGYKEWTFSARLYFLMYSCWQQRTWTCSMLMRTPFMMAVESFIYFIYTGWLMFDFIMGK